MLHMVGTKCLVGKPKSSHWLCTTVAKAQSKKNLHVCVGLKGHSLITMYINLLDLA